jgi:hypothetical protein
VLRPSATRTDEAFKDVITGQRTVQQDKSMALIGFVKPMSVTVPVFSEFKQKIPVVAPMGDVPN